MRIILYSIITFKLLTSTLNASVSEGKEIYSNVCLGCHPYAKDLASKKTSKEWKHVFKHQDSTDILTQIHLRQKEAKKSWTYFKDQEYHQHRRHLRDFMLKYSSDIGKHNSCF